MNIIAISGILSKDVELRYTQTGVAIGAFSIAHNAKVKQGEQWVDEVSFFDCKVFGRTAEIINQYFCKGKRIVLNGRLKQESWQTKDGGKAYRVVILVDGFEFPEKQQTQEQTPAPAPQYQMPKTQAQQTQQYHPQQQTMDMSGNVSGDVLENEIPF